MRVRLICLAAGNSRRFGENKLFYKIGKKPMYRHLLERLVSIAGRHRNYELVLVSQYKELLREAVSLAEEAPRDDLSGFREGAGGPEGESSREAGEPQAACMKLPGLYPVYSPESQNGISYSIRAGILAEASAPDAYVFFAADQPWLSEKTIEAFLEAMEHGAGEKDGRIGCVSHNGESGNPVWFSSGYREELLALTGDQGGKRVMKAHMDRVRLFEVEEARELFDMDTKEDLPEYSQKQPGMERRSEPR